MIELTVEQRGSNVSGELPRPTAWPRGAFLVRTDERFEDRVVSLSLWYIWREYRETMRSFFYSDWRKILYASHEHRHLDCSDFYFVTKTILFVFACIFLCLTVYRVFPPKNLLFENKALVSIDRG